MSLELRAFNDEGLQKFEQFLNRVQSGGSAKGRDALLQDDLYTDVVSPAISVSPRAFENRREAGMYFVRLFESVDEKELRSAGVWAWLTLCYFDSVCPADDKGQRKVGESARYIPVFANYRKYYRHLLYGPFSICLAHNDNPERALATLCTPVDKPGDAVESLASRQELVTCPAVMEAASQLYVKDGKLKRGAGRKNNGGARRFAGIMKQLELTYDLFRISATDLIDMLPSEFDEFRPES